MEIDDCCFELCLLKSLNNDRFGFDTDPVELLRNKSTMPYDLYKEIIINYREIIGDLEIWRIQEYASIFPKKKMISKALDEEVM